MAHAATRGRRDILRAHRARYSELRIVIAMFIRLLPILPALLLTLLYGQATGDVGNAHAVVALLLGMGIGVQFGRPRTEG